MGAINVKHTGAGADIALSSDGTSLLLDGTAIGGGGGASASTVVTKPDAYTVGSSDLGYILIFTGSWNEYATLGSAATLGSGFYVTIINQSGKTHIINRTGSDTFMNNGSVGDTQFKLASGAAVTLVSDGTSKWLSKNISPYLYAECNNNSGNFNPVATGTGAVALGRGANAGGSPSFAAGTNSGFSGSTANGAGSTALGGSYASGSNSFAAAIANNTSSYGASGANSVAIGQYSRATGGGGISIGSAFARADGGQSIAIGRNVHATDNNSMALGNEAVSDVRGKLAYSGGKISATGDSQYGLCVLRQQTTDATASVMKTTAYNANPSADNQIILSNNSAYAFSGTIVARQQASQGTASAAWKIEGLIRREGSAGTTVLVNSATTVLDNTPAWGMALTADVTNGGLAITVTGAASTNVRFVATINTSEVTY